MEAFGPTPACFEGSSSIQERQDQWDSNFHDFDIYQADQAMFLDLMSVSLACFYSFSFSSSPANASRLPFRLQKKRTNSRKRKRNGNKCEDGGKQSLAEFIFHACE